MASGLRWEWAFVYKTRFLDLGLMRPWQTVLDWTIELGQKKNSKSQKGKDKDYKKMIK